MEALYEATAVYEIESIQPLGNYAVQISWTDQFNQVATFDLLSSLPRVSQDSSAATVS